MERVILLLFYANNARERERKGEERLTARGDEWQVEITSE